MGRVEGKVAIVPGAASGLGAADARLPAAEGASVIMPDLNEPARRTLAARGDYAQLWGQGWFAFPNPVYGDSITGTIGEVYPETHRWKPGTPRSDAPAIMNEGN